MNFQRLFKSIAIKKRRIKRARKDVFKQLNVMLNRKSVKKQKQKNTKSKPKISLGKGLVLNRRLECDVYKKVKKSVHAFDINDGVIMNNTDDLDGYEFELFCSRIIRKNGFINVSLTATSGDQGVDIIAYKDNLKYAFQCKHYSNSLGNKPIQEVYAGKTFYQCDVAVVITNSTFTEGAKALAKSTGVILWDRSVLHKLVKNAEKHMVN